MLLQLRLHFILHYVYKTKGGCYHGITTTQKMIQTIPHTCYTRSFYEV